jgi:hypothetical protein
MLGLICGLSEQGGLKDVNPKTLLTPGKVRATHAKLACEACDRRTPEPMKLVRVCLACHEKDDVHVVSTDGNTAAVTPL